VRYYKGANIAKFYSAYLRKRGDEIVCIGLSRCCLDSFSKRLTFSICAFALVLPVSVLEQLEIGLLDDGGV
jgi:hypothetical protein